MRLFYILIFITAVTNAQFYGPDDFRISDAGGFGNNLINAEFPDMAYNPVTQNYLVVWESDDTDQAGVVSGDKQIIGRFVDLNGVVVGNDFLISSLNLGSSTLRNEVPRIAFNTIDNNFIVVYEGEISNGKNEIYIVVVDGNGTIITSDFRLSNTGANGDGRSPAIAYNPILNEYLVVYMEIVVATNTIPGSVEIQGQRLSNFGTLIGSPFAITDSSTGAQTNGSFPDVIYNSVSNDYVVTYVASPINNEEEAFTTLVGQTGIVGATTRLSNRGSLSNSGFGNLWVRAAWDQVNNQYLFVYESPNGSANEFDVFGVIYDSAMNLVVPEFEISMVAGSSTTNDAITPDVEWSRGDNSYYVVFRANPFFSNRNEYEIFMRSVTNAGVVGANLLRVSSAPVDEAGSARFPRIVSNGNNALLTVYEAEDTSPASMMVDREYEVYGQFYGSPSLSVRSTNNKLLSVYPNPVLDRLFIDSNDATILSIQLYDLMGKEILKKSTNESEMHVVDLSEVRKGLYFLKVTTDKGVEVVKVSKK